MATKLADHEGKFAAIAQHPTISVHISSLIRQDPVTPLQLRQIVSECCLEIHHIAVDKYGSMFLLNLIQKLQAMGLVSEILNLFSHLTRDATRLKSTIGLNQIGCRTLFDILLCLPSKKHELLCILESIFIDMFYYSDHLIDHLFILYNPTELKGLLVQISWNFLPLSKNHNGNKNMCALVQSACSVIQDLLISLLRDDFWKAAKAKKGSILLQKMISPLLILKLSGHFFDLSVTTFGHFLVQSCIISACFDSYRFISSELDPRIPLLIRHRFGNYVVQQVIKRSKFLNLTLPPQLKWILENKRQELQSDEWGIHVLRSYDQ